MNFNHVKIVDGDTIYVKGEKIRLSLTNTPERNEPDMQKLLNLLARCVP